MTTVIKKWGNSQGIRIPKYLLDAVKLKEDDEIVLKVKDDKIIIEKSETRKNIKELFADYEGTYEPKEINWGKEEGEELW